MYDRLYGIYGFGNFNFGSGDDGAAPTPGSYADDDTPSSSSSSSSSSLFDDILSGGTSEEEGGASSSGDSMPWPPPSSQSSLPGGCVDLGSIPPFRDFRVLHVDPMVLAINDFFTSEECDEYVRASVDSGGGDVADGDGDDRDGATRRPVAIGQSRTVGKDQRSRAMRTSTTWFHHYAGAPELVAKACRLLGLDVVDDGGGDGGDIRRWEEPQTVRYRRGERFAWHLDALPPGGLGGREEGTASGDGGGEGAGQRVATLLVYLTDMSEGDGGSTMFRDLGGEGNGPLKV